MNTNKTNSRIVGILFILGFLGALTASLTRPIIYTPNFLTQIAANENQILLGVFFLTIMALVCAGIGISLYPILKKYNVGLAIGAVGFRLIEGVLEIISAVFLILLLSLSQEFVKAGAQDSSYFNTLGLLLISGKDWVMNVPALLSWCIGALMYYAIFYRTKLVPRWLAGWGILGASLCIVSTILVLFHIISPFGSIQVFMNVPIALQELVLAAWLIVKGFNSSEITSGSTKNISI